MAGSKWSAGTGITTQAALLAADKVSGLRPSGPTNSLWTAAVLALYVLDVTGVGTAAAGLRLNNLTTTQQNAVTSPVAGNLIWNTTTVAPSVYDGSAWQGVGLLNTAQTWSAAQTHTASVTFSGAPIIISGNISAAAWTTSGIRIKGTPGTLTDTTSSGTVATAYTDVLGGNTIAASSATTFTNYFSMYVNAGVAGTNVTLTNKWAIGADSLKVGTSNALTVSAAGLLTGTAVVVNELVGSSALTLTGATQTASFPVINATQTWNAGGTTFTGILLNVTSTASAAASLLMDLQVGSATKFNVNKAGNVTAVGDIQAGSNAVYLNASVGRVWIPGTTGELAFTTNTAATSASTVDTRLTRAAAASLQMGAADVDTGPVAQTLRSQGALAGGTSNVAGANWTFIASPGKGTGAGGSFILQTAPAGSTGTAVNAPVSWWILDSAGQITQNLGTLNGTSGTPTSNAITLTNTVAATVSQNQYSPSLHFVGQAWKTTATAASQQIEFNVNLQARNSTGTPNAQLVFIPTVNSTVGKGIAFTGSGSVSGAAQVNATYITGLDGSNAFGVDTGVGWAGIGPVNTNGAFAFFSNASAVATIYNGGLALGNSQVFSLSSSSPPNSVGDVILSRGGAAATLQFGAADVNGNAVAQTLQGQSGITGTDKNGGNFTIIAGKQTGAGTPGNIVLQVANKLGTGTTAGTAATGLTVQYGLLNMQPSVLIGNQALATTATDGFLYIPTCAGTPTGVPTAFTGLIPMIYDTTNHQFWFYDSGWKQPKTPAAAAIVTWQ